MNPLAQGMSPILNNHHAFECDPKEVAVVLLRKSLSRYLSNKAQVLSERG